MAGGWEGREDGGKTGSQVGGRASRRAGRKEGRASETITSHDNSNEISCCIETHAAIFFLFLVL